MSKPAVARREVGSAPPRVPDPQMTAEGTQPAGLPTRRLVPRLVGRLTAHLRQPLYRNGYALILSTGSTSVLGLVFWVLAARLYPADAVGLNSAALAATVLLSGISQLNLMGALIRFLPRAGGATRPLIAGAYLVTTAIAAVTGTIFILGPTRWAPALAALGTNLPLALWFVLVTMTWCVTMLGDNALTGLGRTGWVPLQNTIVAVVKIAFLVLFTRAPFAGVLGDYAILVAYTGPLVLAAVPVNLALFRILIPRHVRATAAGAEPLALGGLVRFVAADYAGMLCWMASTLSLPIVVTALAGASANAYFYQAWTIATALHLISGNMATSLTVEGAADQARLGGYGRSALIGLLRLLVLPVAALVTLAPVILHLFGPDYAAEGATTLRLLALAALPNAVIALYLGMARVRRRMAEVFLVQALSCALVLGLSALLLPRLGITGVGLAWLTSQGVVAILLSRRLLGGWTAGQR